MLREDEGFETAELKIQFGNSYPDVSFEYSVRLIIVFQLNFEDL